MTYSFVAQSRKATPQTQAIPGREAEMVQGRSGGFGFKPSIWTMLRRCLITGTASGSFYAGKNELTQEFIDTVNAAVKEDPKRVAEEILYASDGRAINNSAPIFALVLLSMGESVAAKAAFRSIFLQVVRTGSHFHEWTSYTKQLRGMGRTVREAGLAWLQCDDVEWLTYQMLKYQQRYGMSFRDELRLFKPKPKTIAHDGLYGYVAKNVVPEESEDSDNYRQLFQINWYEFVKSNPQEGVRAVREGGLTHEMIAPIANMNKDVWQALFEKMPVTATLRNLGSLTDIGVITFSNTQNLDRIEAMLCNKDILRKARIHPIDVLKALKTYASGGSLGRSKKTWQPVDRVVDILETALELSFETQEPTGKVFCHALDVSGSMSYGMVDSIGLTCAEIATTMALVTAKAEKNYAICGFSTEFIDLGITAKDSFSSACRKTHYRNFGGTNASVAFEWATKNKIHFDVFCFWTDSESWAGYNHPSQALAEYRRKVNPDAKAIYTTLQVSNISLVDPKDNGSYDFGGFDPSIPKAIQMIAAGEI